MAQTTHIKVGDGTTNSGNIIGSFNNKTFYGSDEDVQIMRWLSPLEPNNRHQGVRIDRLDGVGNWVLETNEFRRWCDRKNGCAEPVLFCSGGPGVGKTYLSSLVIDRLCDQVGGKDVAVGLYCDYLAQQEQSTPNMLGAILKQLANKGGISQHIREAFKKAKGELGGRGLQLPDLVELLKETIASLQQVFICIDALDESEPKNRRALIVSLREIVCVSPNARIFLTGRTHIDDEIVKCFNKVVRIPISPTQGDIKSYLKMKLDGDTDPSALDDKLRADIMRVIPEKISEIFLLVSLNIDAILGEITLHQRRKKLDDMTRGKELGDTYAATLSRVKAQQGSRSKLGMKVLMWVSHSERPLHVDELCHALGVEEGSVDLNTQNIPAIETLIASSLGLVTVERSSSTVRPVHYTLQEYLSNNPTLFIRPHSAIAEVCLAYLNFRHIREFSPALRSAPPTAPFVKYASCYWGTHARRETTESVKSLALKLLDGYDRHISSTMLLLDGLGAFNAPFDGEGNPRGFTGLHGAAYLGCVEIIVALLEMSKWDVQAIDFHGNTAITWASRMGHEAVVKVLLEQNGVNPDIADSQYGRTPLLWAAESGHEGVVKMLLERKDVNPDKADTRPGRTALWWAAENGNEGVARMLLERNGVNPNIADTWSGRTPLWQAAQNGHEGVVRMLLGRNDVNPNIADTWSDRTLLLWAAENGHEWILRMLLERNDVNPNTANTRYGQTPLLQAAENGHEGVVRMLLGRNDVYPNKTDTLYDRTPLLWAARNGHEGIVKMLLERNDVDPNLADTWSGQTPLLWAAENGHEGIVRMLLQREDIYPDEAETQYGRTPLLWAAENGHEGVVKMLLERDDVNPNIVDTSHCRTALWWAAKNENEGIVRILLERDDVVPDIADGLWGRTPLLWAAVNRHEGILSLLLERKDVNPNAADTEYGRPPLLWAAENRHEELVRVLLERSDVDPNTADTKYGRTLLSWAAENGYEGLVRMLLERDDVDPNIPDTWLGRTPLLWAARNGHGGVVRMLLQREDIYPNEADDLWGRTLLLYAAENGYEGLVRVLLERDDVNPNTPDAWLGRTPLLWAACNGHEGVVRMLLERGEVNPDATDTEYGRTPLLWAAENGHEGVVRILERNAVDRCIADAEYGRMLLRF